MDAPLHIEYRGLTESDALSSFIRRKANALTRLNARIAGCRVVVEQAHRRGRPGEHFHVHVEVAVPGATLVTAKDPPDRRQSDAQTAVTEAFAAVRRQLQAWVPRRTRKTVRRSVTHP